MLFETVWFWSSYIVTSLLSWSPILSGKHYSSASWGRRGNGTELAQGPRLQTSLSSKWTLCIQAVVIITVFPRGTGCLALYPIAALWDLHCWLCVCFPLGLEWPSSVCVSVHICFLLESHPQPSYHLLWEVFLHALLTTWTLWFSLAGLSEPASSVCSQASALKLETKPSSCLYPPCPVPWLPNS